MTNQARYHLLHGEKVMANPRNKVGPRRYGADLWTEEVLREQNFNALKALRKEAKRSRR